jgi:hypothetical protein
MLGFSPLGDLALADDTAGPSVPITGTVTETLAASETQSQTVVTASNIQSLGTLGLTGTSVNSATFAFTTVTTGLAAGDFAIFTFSIGNLGTVDGATNDHLSMSGGTGTWTKLGEWTDSQGAAGSGVVVSAWLFEATGANAIGTTMTLTLASARVDKVVTGWAFSKAVGYSIILDPQPATNPIGNNLTGTDFGSQSFSSLTQREHLFFMAGAKKGNFTGTLTPSSGFSAIDAGRSRNNASARYVAGEFDIVTATGATSSPAEADSGPTAALFIALLPQAAGISAAITEAATAADAPDATITTGGASAVTEAGSAIEASSAALITAAAAAEAGTASDTASVTAILAASRTENGFAIDIKSAQVDFQATASEIGTATDAEAATATYAVGRVEAGAATDSATATGGAVPLTPGTPIMGVWPMPVIAGAWPMPVIAGIWPMPIIAGAWLQPSITGQWPQQNITGDWAE